jgi:hypothetical protein
MVFCKVSTLLNAKTMIGANFFVFIYPIISFLGMLLCCLVLYIF